MPFPAQRGSQSGLGSFPGGPSGELLTSGGPPHHAEHGVEPRGRPGSGNYW